MELAALCGLSEFDFWDITPRYMSALVTAYERGLRDNWERARYVSFHAIKSADTKNRIKKATDLGKFPWEVKRPKKMTVQDAAEAQVFDAEADEILRKTNPAAYAAYMKAHNG